MYIENMQGPEDVKKLTLEQLPVLAEEMRHALLIRASKHGGHFGPNFGMVEATIALHYVFDSPKDKIVYDVSHQSYPHKMLTGRKDAYLYEEKYDDVSGYSNPHESEHDFFTVGHTSTSVSLAAGLAKVSADKKVVLGLITTKTPELEEKERIIARIHEAAKYIPLDRLCLSPQCGFASCEIGNKLTEEEQWAKLKLVKEIAEEVWGK